MNEDAIRDDIAELDEYLAQIPGAGWPPNGPLVRSVLRNLDTDWWRPNLRVLRRDALRALTMAGAWSLGRTRERDDQLRRAVLVFDRLEGSFAGSSRELLETIGSVISE